MEGLEVDLEAENTALKQALAERDAEIVFLRERLSNLRSLVEELASLQGEESDSSTPQKAAPLDTSGSAFPGVKVCICCSFVVFLDVFL